MPSCRLQTLSAHLISPPTPFACLPQRGRRQSPPRTTSSEQHQPPYEPGAVLSSAPENVASAPMTLPFPNKLGITPTHTNAPSCSNTPLIMACPALHPNLQLVLSTNCPPPCAASWPHVAGTLLTPWQALSPHFCENGLGNCCTYFSASRSCSWQADLTENFHCTQ